MDILVIIVLKQKQLFNNRVVNKYFNFYYFI
jgi:hypothetical protein